MDNWLAFWNAPQHPYVPSTQHARFYREIAEELVRVAGTSRGARCLDLGCGETLDCPELLAQGASVPLHDPAPRMRRLATERYAGEPGVSLPGTSDFETTPHASLDLIAVISVVQCALGASKACLVCGAASCTRVPAWYSAT